MRDKKYIWIGIVLLALIGVLLSLKMCQRTAPSVSELPIEQPVSPALSANLEKSIPPVEPVKPAVEEKSIKEVKKTASPVTIKKTTPPSPVMQPPPVVIHKELIPKNIEIVRVYYVNFLAAPGSSVEFDINGSGFTSEFQKMITVKSGHPQVSVKNLMLITANQIHGTLVIGPEAPTIVSFPQVLINDKVVFQAQDPFGIIRPGEVLNVIFTEMGESGRTGKFRVFTNLTEEMFKEFKVTTATSAIVIADLTPTFPFIVDGEIQIGPAASGDYGMKVELGRNVLWDRPGIIRVVQPNVGQAGLIQRIFPMEGFYRPGDRAKFLIQGSGFQPQDAQLLSAQVEGFTVEASTFTYLAPGRMELSFRIPTTAPENRVFPVAIKQGEQVLLNVPNLFAVVARNWLRELRVEPDLGAGGVSTVQLIGRDMSKEFIEKLVVEVDEPSLQIEKFQWENSGLARAIIKADSGIKPGDYILHMSTGGASISAEFGNIIRVKRPSNSKP